MTPETPTERVSLPNSLTVPSLSVILQIQAEVHYLPTLDHLSVAFVTSTPPLIDKHV